MRRVAAVFAMVAVLAVACGDSNEPVLSPEEVTVRPARADWSSGYFQAAIYSELLRALGYQVDDESLSEMGPDLFYPALAQGNFDYWVNGWFPIHEADLDTEHPTLSGSVGDHVAPIGNEVGAGALQGFQVNLEVAERGAITSLGQIADDPELREQFDADGDGAAEVFGCNASWGCAGIINETFTVNGWDSKLAHVQGDYDVQFGEVMRRVAAGQPTVFYAWTPTYVGAELVVGADVVWLGLGGETLQGQGGSVELPPGHCVADPCGTGFGPADIRVVANNKFLDANPVARSLFELVEIPLEDISAQNVRLRNDGGDQAAVVKHAREWIDGNRSLVDTWLDQARAAS